MPGMRTFQAEPCLWGFKLPTVTKHFIAIGLLCTLLTPPLLVCGWFQLTRAELRREARQHLQSQAKPGELVALEFTFEEARTALHWERPDEFEYQGNMYDVMRVEQAGEKVRFWCWPDQPETRLNRELRALTAQLLRDAPQPKEQAGHLLAYFKSLFYCEADAWQAIGSSVSESDAVPCEHEYNSPVLSIRPAPPRQA